MKRTTVNLPDEIVDRLAREARRRGTSISEVTRQALAAHFGLGSDDPRRVPIAGLGCSGHSNTAEDFERLLAEHWLDDRSS